MTNELSYKFPDLFAHFDANGVKARLIKVKKENETEIKRIFNVALPFIHMYQPASKYIGLSFQAYDLSILLRKTASDVFNLEVYTSLTDIAKIACLTSSVALSILNPQVYAIGSTAYELAKNLNQFRIHISVGNFKSAAFELLAIVRDLANLGMFVYAGPELLALSLLVQALKEIAQSKYEFKEGRVLEGIANLIYASIRFKAAVPHIQATHRNHYGKEMNQKDLDFLIKEIAEINNQNYCKEKEKELVDFDRLLTKYNFKK